VAGREELGGTHEDASRVLGRDGLEHREPGRER
jgi:hypothetical protein